MPKAIRVLIADDNEDFVEIFQRYLASHSDIDIVGVAQNGMQAYEMTVQLKPDVLILDLIMPDMDGLEALRRIRALETNTPIIIALSGLSNGAVTEQALVFGADRYFIKPYIDHVVCELHSLFESK